MNYKDSKIAAVVAGIALVAFGASPTLRAADAPAIKRNIVLKEDMSIPGREGVMVYVDIPPGGAEGKHTHPAEVYAFLLEGTISLEIDGKPTVTLKAGDIFHVPPNTIHQATNTGGTPV
jgi:quercetin dioxygenase-like cupin family protein